jgi:hypothetical protein
MTDNTAAARAERRREFKRQLKAANKQHQTFTRQRLAIGRSCGECSLCCKLYPLKEYQKPAQVMCQHCVPGKGCGIYDTRAPVCREFACSWLTRKEIGPHWYPLVSKMVLTNPAGTNYIQVSIENGFADNWQQEPYKSDLIQWSFNKPVIINNRENHRKITILRGCIAVEENVIWIDETSLDLAPNNPDEVKSPEFQNKIVVDNKGRVRLKTVLDL